MLADFVRALSLEKYGAFFKTSTDSALMRNSEYFAEMWEKAETNSKNIKWLK